MENRHPVDALFEELEERGVRDRLSPELAANWELIRAFAGEQYGRFWAYKHMRLKELEGSDYYKQFLGYLSGEVQREVGIRAGKMSHRYVWSIPPLGLLYWAAYKTVNSIKRRRQMRRPYTMKAFGTFGEGTQEVFREILNSYQNVLESG